MPRCDICCNDRRQGLRDYDCTRHAACRGCRKVFTDDCPLCRQAKTGGRTDELEDMIEIDCDKLQTTGNNQQQGRKRRQKQEPAWNHWNDHPTEDAEKSVDDLSGLNDDIERLLQSTTSLNNIASNTSICHENIVVQSVQRLNATTVQPVHHFPYYKPKTKLKESHGRRKKTTAQKETHKVIFMKQEASKDSWMVDTSDEFDFQVVPAPYTKLEKTGHGKQRESDRRICCLDRFFESLGSADKLQTATTAVSPASSSSDEWNFSTGHVRGIGAVQGKLKDSGKTREIKSVRNGDVTVCALGSDTGATYFNAMFPGNDTEDEIIFSRNSEAPAEYGSDEDKFTVTNSPVPPITTKIIPHNGEDDSQRPGQTEKMNAPKTQSAGSRDMPHDVSKPIQANHKVARSNITKDEPKSKTTDDMAVAVAMKGGSQYEAKTEVASDHSTSARTVWGNKKPEGNEAMPVEDGKKSVTPSPGAQRDAVKYGDENIDELERGSSPCKARRGQVPASWIAPVAAHSDNSDSDATPTPRSLSTTTEVYSINLKQDTEEPRKNTQSQGRYLFGVDPDEGVDDIYEDMELEGPGFGSDDEPDFRTGLSPTANKHQSWDSRPSLQKDDFWD